jgi:hypothetical protein
MCLFQVTSDIQAIMALNHQFLIISLALGGIARAVFGPLPFWATFGLIKMFEVFLSLSFGLMNVSALLQMAIIMDTRELSSEYL